ncbi:MAG TPA: hemolysin family protein [Candidatus Limnocylindrales bacterium]|jgi:putative hemolysin|nr:hemolysin family protein [Candidatus Limnocylindrales bacterium]
MAAAPMIPLLVVLVFAAASFFFSLAETTLFSLSKWQVRQVAERDPGRGGLVARMLTEPQDLLATMALGNTCASAAMLAVGLWMAWEGDWPLVSTLVGLLILMLIGCEVLPKTMAVRKPEQWALRVARPFSWVLAISRPLCRVAQEVNASILRAVIPKTLRPQSALTDADYQELLELAYQQGALAQSEKEIILQIINLDQRTAKEVMKPRSQMAAISDDFSIEEMIAAARQYKHRRLPIYDESPDTIVGILNTRALLLDPHIDLADAIEFPSFVPESMNLLQLLKSLQRQQRGLAIVLDEYGGTAGIVTMEDILEEMIGKIRGEVGSESLVMEKLGTGLWRVSGLLRVDDFRREYPALGEVPEVETLGGLLMSLLDVVPTPGESATFRGLKLTAKTTDERRVREMTVEILK